MDTPNEIQIQGFLDDWKETLNERCPTKEDDLLFFQFPKWLAVKWGIAVKPDDLEGMRRAFADFGGQFLDEVGSQQKEEIYG